MKNVVATLSLVAPLVWGGAALAQQPLPPAGGQPDVIEQQTLPPVSPPADVSEWIGATVVSADGKEVGEVAEVRQAPDGEPVEVVTRIGAVLGFGGTDVALPVSSASYEDGLVRVSMVEVDIQALADSATDPGQVVQ